MDVYANMTLQRLKRFLRIVRGLFATVCLTADCHLLSFSGCYQKIFCSVGPQVVRHPLTIIIRHRRKYNTGESVSVTAMFRARHPFSRLSPHDHHKRIFG